ncbi:RtcB family protein [Patescibacteria group bacterium]|nr:RtcB family protein [Patescibacteria group bacterium]
MDLARLRKIEEYLWEIPQDFRSDMRVPARIFATEKLLSGIAGDRSLEQLMNVAALPGIRRYALAMPDVHEGYGFPVGGVAAFGVGEGIISPGGIGYDINCGVRLLLSDMRKEEAEAHAHDLARAIFAEVPSGTGRGGALSLTDKELDLVLLRGAKHMAELGYAQDGDLAHIESGGVLPGADPAAVSARAKARGSDQLGTIGAGNHFIEVGFVDEVLDAKAAHRMGLALGRATVLIHTGSRGLGHQVATDYIREMVHAIPKYRIALPDRELACAPFASAEGQAYFCAMNAAGNFAWANRQLITARVRHAWRGVFGTGEKLSVLYDVAHNIAKVEPYALEGKSEDLLVHRKGATRAFPGQPVLIPGSMGTASYVLIGGERSLEASFGSSCHGAGRVMSRTKARTKIGAKQLRADLEAQGITIAAGSRRGFTEEAPFAYKDIDEVVSVIHDSGIASKVARLRPLAVVKG